MKTKRYQMIVALLAILWLSNAQNFPDRQFVEEFWNGLQNKGALGWDMTKSVCGQKGVNCASQRITRLNFSNFRLRATLPESIGFLEELTQLNGNNNQFFGTVPGSLKNLRKCVQINLNDNELSGIFPNSVFSVSSLQRVHIHNNFFTGNSGDLAIGRVNQLLMTNNSFYCPIVDYSNIRTNDFISSRNLCNMVCPPSSLNLCAEGTYCASSGKGSLTRACVAPLPCNAVGAFPLTPAGINVTALACPANEYGMVTKFCSGFNVWKEVSSSCNSCPPGSNSAPGSESLSDCVCPSGFSLTASGCVDIDECLTQDPCDSNALCRNTIGSFKCTCKEGFSGDGKDCQDIDECQTTNLCGNSGQCLNTQGSYSCICNDGSEFNGKECIDIDECSLIPSVCPLNSQCFNTVPFYFCSCNAGFSFSNSQCIPGPRLQSTIGFQPFAIWNFDYLSNPSHDFSGNENDISLEGNSVVPFYSRGNPENRAVFLDFGRLLTPNPILFSDNYAIEVIFNAETLVETDFISLSTVPNADPSFSPMRIRMTSRRRLQLYNRLTLIGTSISSYQVGVTNYLIVSAQRTQIVLFLNGVRIGAFMTTPESGNFFLQIGSTFRGHIDEINVLDVPIFGRDAPFRDDFIECDTLCPAGQVCVNRFDGVYCQ